MADRPDLVHYYLGLAVGVSSRAECVGLKVGAVLVRGNRVVSTGYNGAPEGFGNCSDGGVCPRCDERETFGSGNGYDKCICVHAEMNAIAAAARFGMAIEGATAYVTHQPCITCAKELIQAGVRRVYFGHELPVGDKVKKLDTLVKATHQRLMGQLEAIHVDPAAVAQHAAVAVDRFGGGSATIAAPKLVPVGKERRGA